MGQIARCYISPIEPGHPDTCHTRDFSGSLRLPASLTHIRGESCGGPSLAPSDVSKYFPCESQWQLFLLSRLAGTRSMLSLFRRGEENPNFSFYGHKLSR